MCFASTDVRDEAGEWLIAIGEAAQDKHCFHAGLSRGHGGPRVSVAVDDPRLETATLYKTSLILPLGFGNLTAFENGPKSPDRQGPAPMLWHDYLKTFG